MSLILNGDPILGSRALRPQSHFSPFSANSVEYNLWQYGISERLYGLAAYTPRAIHLSLPDAVCMLTGSPFILSRLRRAHVHVFPLATVLAGVGRLLDPLLACSRPHHLLLLAPSSLGTYVLVGAFLKLEDLQP